MLISNKISANILKRSKENLNLKFFEESVELEDLNLGFIDIDNTKLKQESLRMPLLVKEGRIELPKSMNLEALQDFCDHCIGIQREKSVVHHFWYLTVRIGMENSRSEAWHADGFSLRIPHVPEWNYVWSSKIPTEFWMGSVKFPDDFDAKIFNVHKYIGSQIDAGITSSELSKEKCVYLIDPYVVHRKQIFDQSLVGCEDRVFVRLSNVPIEIEDDNHTANPEMERKYYNRVGSKIYDELRVYK